MGLPDEYSKATVLGGGQKVPSFRKEKSLILDVSKIKQDPLVTVIRLQDIKNSDFERSQAASGVEDDLAFGWVIDCLEKCLPKAEECGVTLGLENHWGLGRTAAGVLRIINAIASPWLRATMDTGNFLEDPYEQLAEMA